MTETTTVTRFPTVRAKRPTVRGSGDNLAEISTPEVIEAHVEQMFFAAWLRGLTVWGYDKTADIMLRAAKSARGVANE